MSATMLPEMKTTLRILICCVALMSPLVSALIEHCDAEDKSSCRLPPMALKSVNNCEGQMLTIKQGEICGKLKHPDPLLPKGQPYLAYQGIPFAQPPVNKLRFMDPVAAGPWEGIRDGSWSPPVCPQFNIESFFTGSEPEVHGSEDCLYLNVFRPQIDSHNLPVMVFIHGGAFILGGIGELDAEMFMTQDIILVAIQYRLGFLGFLSTEDSVVPGNQALKDQELALHWVKENIASFGGDKERVTIFGESAGAISVHLQMLNPRAAGLFSRAILQSGTAFIGTLVPTQVHRDTAKQLSVKLNCTSAENLDKSDSDAILKCAQSTSPDLLVFMLSSFSEWNMAPVVLGPRIDGEVIPEHPSQLMRDGKYHKVDIIAGTNKDEGMMFAKGLIANPTLLDDIATRFSEIGKYIFPTDLAVTEKLIKYYMGNIRQFTKDDFKALTEMYGNYYFHIPNDISMELYARDTLYGYQVFAYELHHRGNWSFMEELVPELGKDMVNHADELQYMFNLSMISSPTPIDRKLSGIILKLWSNFAAYGNPTPDRSMGFTWSPVSLKHQPHLVLEPQPYMESDTRCEVRKFFETLDMPLSGHDKLFPGEIALGVDWRTWRSKYNNGNC
ncbi:unnamed protein product [Meganyctiphanes norvegica]|uniref:Carboxylic ester hydrolase n=1 Tax=Meganyctiphanes norvegica TaxID=48144 RepID=A0AAV2REC1_MEGNR